MPKYAIRTGVGSGIDAAEDDLSSMCQDMLADRWKPQGGASLTVNDGMYYITQAFYREDLPTGAEG